MLHCVLTAASAGDVFPLIPMEKNRSLRFGMPYHRLVQSTHSSFAVGSGFFTDAGQEILRVTGRICLSLENYAAYYPLVTAQTDIPVGEALFHVHKKGRSLAWITLSDKGAQGLREDTSGPAIAATIRDTLPLCHEQGFLLPDDPAALRTLVTELSLGQGFDIICTTGGTGVGPRDITPETLAPILDKQLPGFATAMLLASLQKTPHAMISRAVCGILGKSLIITLPGSRKAVLENLDAVLPALAHTLDKLHGDPADCGG